MIAYSSLKKNVLKPLLRMILPVISVMSISFIIIPESRAKYFIRKSLHPRSSTNLKIGPFDPGSFNPSMEMQTG
jgi:hypothetical protein